MVKSRFDQQTWSDISKEKKELWILIHLIKVLDSFRYLIVNFYFNPMVPEDIGLTTFFQNLGGFSYDL